MRKVILVICSLCVVSCASKLTVKVDVYDGPVPPGSISQVNLAEQVLNNPVFIRSEREKITRDAISLIEPIYKQSVIDNASASFSEEQKIEAANTQWDGGNDSIKPALETQFKRADEAAYEVYDIAVQLEGLLKQREIQLFGEEIVALYDLITSALVKYNTSFEETISDLDFLGVPANVLASIKLSTKAFYKQRNLSGVATAGEVNGKHIGYPLFDPDISDVIKYGIAAENNPKEPSPWVPFVRNEFSTNGGSSQFVVVREGLVVFHPKSLDFDPTPVIGAGTAVTKLGVKVAAALSSGTINIISQADGANDMEVQKTELFNEVEMQSNSEMLKRRHDARIQLLEELADLIEDTPNADIEELKKAIEKQIGFYSARVSTK